MSTHATDAIHALLKERFGHLAFRPGQLEVIETVLARRDALGVMPTGGGKSLCYQLPALLLSETVVVISPLIALMKDQVDSLRRMGVDGVATMNSSLDAQESADCVEALCNGELSLLFVAPERATLPEFATLLRRSRVALFVVDEAHCVSHWGHDFRPQYRQLGGLFQAFPEIPVLALTATATPRVREDIVRALPLRQPVEVTLSFNRPNLHFSVLPAVRDTKLSAIRRLLRESPGSAILYVRRRKDAEEVAAALRAEEITAAPYHAGLPDTVRHKVQEAFQQDRYRVVVATVAFGMGIDKPDIRTVLHYHLPEAIESYYQEVGRAGRDGDPARGVLLYDRRDLSISRYLIQEGYPTENQAILVYRRLLEGSSMDEIAAGMNRWSTTRSNAVLSILAEADAVTLDNRGNLMEVRDVGRLRLDLSERQARREADLARLEAMQRYAQRQFCRRSMLLEYFGEQLTEPCVEYCCDQCDKVHHRAGAEPATQARVDTAVHVQSVEGDETESATAIAILGAAKTFSGQVGRTLLAQILAGSGTSSISDKQRATGHFGMLRSYTVKSVFDAIDTLQGSGHLDLNPGEYPTVVWVHDSPPFPPLPLKITAQRQAMAEVDPGEPVPRRIGIAILKTVNALDGQLPVSMVAGALLGNVESGVLHRYPEVATLATYAMFHDSTYPELRDHVRRMIAKEYLAFVAKGGRKLTLTKLGRQALQPRPAAEDE